MDAGTYLTDVQQVVQTQMLVTNTPGKKIK